MSTCPPFISFLVKLIDPVKPSFCGNYLVKSTLICKKDLDVVEVLARGSTIDELTNMVSDLLTTQARRDGERDIHAKMQKDLYVVEVLARGSTIDELTNMVRDLLTMKARRDGERDIHANMLVVPTTPTTNEMSERTSKRPFEKMWC